MSGSLGMGKSKNSSSSQQTSDAYGYNQSMSQDMSQSGSSSTSVGQSTSTQSLAFADLFQQLYGGAAGAAQGALGQVPMLAASAQQLFTGGMGFLDNLGQDAGTQYLTNRVSGANPVLDEQLAGLRTEMQTLFSEDLMPGITARSVAGGTLGGGRQGVAEGLASKAVLSEYAKGATALRAQDQAARDSAAATVAGNSLAAANTGLGALPGLLELSEATATRELGVYSSLASILGGPTTLTQSQSTSDAESTAFSLSEALSRAFGENRSTSQGTSKSKGSSWDFNTSGSLWGQ